MFDSPGNDTMYGDPTEVSLYGDGYYNRVKYFEGVHAYGSNGGIDEANLHGSAGDDHFYASLTEASLYGDGFYNRAKGFEKVSGNAVDGGNDVAELHDSALDDLLEAEDDWVRLTNVDLSNIFQQAINFDMVRAFGTTSTNRRSVSRPLSFVLEFLGEWEDEELLP